MLFDNSIAAAFVVVVAVIFCLIIIYAMRKREKNGEVKEKAALETESKGLPLKISKTVNLTEVKRAKKELRILDLEREILSDAIRRFYEAHAEGKITEEEREKLGEMYTSRMMAVKKALSKDETLVALHELESMQADLITLFSERFDDLNIKIDELRTKVEVKPIKEIKIKVPEPSLEHEEKPRVERKDKIKRKPADKISPRIEAERRIEKIKAEVEKVLEKLGQMEIES